MKIRLAVGGDIKWSESVVLAATPLLKKKGEEWWDSSPN
ncbi:hypothetical protein EMIT0180MI3_80081 [Priestia megaterium]